MAPLFIIGLSLLGYAVIMILLYWSNKIPVCIEVGQGWPFIIGLVIAPFAGVAGLVLIFIELITGYVR